MHLGVVGYSESNGGSWGIPTGGEFDRRYLVGPVDKDRVEDLQIWSALFALGRQGAARHPLGIEATKPHQDPPDRWIVHRERRWATELTALTMEHIRRDLGPVRQFGRQLEQRLRAQPARFAHLQGCTVLMGKAPTKRMPRDHTSLLVAIEAALAEE